MKKRYWVILVLLFLVGLDWYIRSPDSHSRELTRAIETQGSEALKAYPYKFRVLKVVGDTAYLSTPRNTEVPAFKALGALFPELNTKDPNNPAFIAAQQRLASVQGDNGIWLAGAWGSYGFHEDGLKSALRVVNGMGIRAPWQGETPAVLHETETA